MPHKKVTYSDERVTAEVEVIQATVLDGMRRMSMQMEAREANKAESDQDRIILRVLVYPDLIAAAGSGSITVDNEPLPWPPSFDDFIGLPEAFVSQWDRAVYELNPHWMPDAQDAEKKA